MSRTTRATGTLVIRCLMALGAVVVAACGVETLPTPMSAPTAPTAGVQAAPVSAGTTDGEAGTAPGAGAVDPPAAPVLTAAGASGSLKLTWSSPNAATGYVVQKRSGDAGAWTDDGAAYPASTTTTDRRVPIGDWSRTRYRVMACNAGGCTASAEVAALAPMAATVTYAKASDSQPGTLFGSSVAVSADGSTMAVGAWGAVPLVGAPGYGLGSPGFGAVYLFAREGTGWRQQARLALGQNVSCGFGYAVALSTDGSVLAVTGQCDNEDAGDVFIYRRSGQTWALEVSIAERLAAAENLFLPANFGLAIALSADGDTLIAGSPTEGVAHVFERRAGTWIRQARLESADPTSFGAAVAVDAAGTTVAIGASDTGRVDVFVREGSAWRRQGGISVPATDLAAVSALYANAGVAQAVRDPENMPAPIRLAMSGDGRTIAVGVATSEAVFVHARVGDAWGLQARLAAPGAARARGFGMSVSLTADGGTLAVGANLEASAATGLDGDGADASTPGAGAVHVFSRIGADWTHRAYLKATRPGARDFGWGVAQSTDGTALAVGARLDPSAAAGIGGDPTGNGSPMSGAVFVF